MRICSMLSVIVLFAVAVDPAFAQQPTDVHFRQSVQHRDLALTEREVPRDAGVRFRVSRVGDGRDDFSIQFDFAPDRRIIDPKLRKQFTNVKRDDYIAFRVGQDSLVVFADSTGQFRRIRHTDEWTSVEFGTGAVSGVQSISAGAVLAAQYYSFSPKPGAAAPPAWG